MIAAVRGPCTNKCCKQVSVGIYSEHANETFSWGFVHCGALVKPPWAYYALPKHVIYHTSCFLKQGINTKHENTKNILGAFMIFKVVLRHYVVKKRQKHSNVHILLENISYGTPTALIILRCYTAYALITTNKLKTAITSSQVGL